MIDFITGLFCFIFCKILLYSVKGAFMKKNKKQINKNKINKMYDFGLGSDASTWEEVTRHMSGYSPRPAISGSATGAYDISYSPHQNVTRDVENIVGNTLRGFDTEIYRALSRMEEPPRGKKLTTAEFNEATHRASGYTQKSPINSINIKNLNNNLANISKPEINKINRLLEINQLPITSEQIKNSFHEDTVQNILINSTSLNEVNKRIRAGVNLANSLRKK